MKTRILFILAMALVAMTTVGCSSSCAKGSTCTSETTGSGSGGGGTNTATAFAFAVDQAGKIDGYTLTSGAGTFASTSSYTAPVVPTNDPGYGMVVAQTKYLYAGFIGTGQIFATPSVLTEV